MRKRRCVLQVEISVCAVGIKSIESYDSICNGINPNKTELEHDPVII